METGKNKKLIFQWFKFSKGQWSLGIHLSKNVSFDYSISEIYINMNLIKWSLSIGIRRVTNETKGDEMR